MGIRVRTFQEEEGEGRVGGQCGRTWVSMQGSRAGGSQDMSVGAGSRGMGPGPEAGGRSSGHC